MQLIDDRYELLEVIASGGMATVWRARDTRLERLVALKRAHPELPGGRADERIEREARAAAALRHPNLVPVYDFGSDDDGPYLVMALIDGPTLEDQIGELEAPEVVESGARLAEALAAIHAAGIVHRDIKPSNIIMSDHGPLLTDFGIATDPNATDELTEPGKVIATPSFASPEVLSGAEPTPASDVYSLGVTIDRVLSRAPGTSDARASAVLASAMASSPEDRPSATELANGLRSAAPTMSVPAVGGSTMILDVAESPDGDDNDVRTGPSGWVWAVGVLALLIGGLLVAVLASQGDPSADASALGADTTTSSSSSTAATASTSTTATTAPPTTREVTREEQIIQTRDRLESILLAPPRSDLKQHDVDEIMKKVDEAIDAAGEDDLDKAAKKLTDAAESIEDDAEGRSAEEALAQVDRLAELLGVDLGQSDEDRD